MSDVEQLDKMSDLCIDAAYVVMQIGTEELKAAMGVTLAALERDISQRPVCPATPEAEMIRIRQSVYA